LARKPFVVDSLSIASTVLSSTSFDFPPIYTFQVLNLRSISA
jgi:hypothetical protein